MCVSKSKTLAFLFFLSLLGSIKAQTSFDLIIIFKPTATWANITATKMALSAVQLDSTFPSRALLWRCSVPIGSTITLPLFAGGFVTSAAVLPGSTGSEAVGVICQSGQSDGVGLNDVFIIPESDIPREGQQGGSSIYSGCTTVATDSIVNCKVGKRMVKIAVMDSGIDCSVVQENIVIKHDSIRPFVCYRTTEKLNNVDDDNNGYKDDIIGYDFVNNDGVPEDSTGHGTFVSGVITRVLKRNSGDTIKFFALKVLNRQNKGFEYNFIRALDYAMKQKVEVVNCSFVSSSILLDTMTPFTSAILTARSYGVLVSLAAGNNALNIDNQWVSPPSYQSDNTIVTGATVCTDSIASFSNFGKRNADVFTPAKNVISTWLNNSFAIHSGTSFAAPQTTAIAALLASNLSAQDWQRVKCSILRGSSYRAFLSGKCRRSGLLNGQAARNILTTAAIPCDDLLNKTDVVLENIQTLSVYPNPFSSSLTVDFTLKNAATVDVNLYNNIGQLIVTNRINGIVGQNQHPLSMKGQKLDDGIYFIQIMAGEDEIVRKVICAGSR